MFKRVFQLTQQQPIDECLALLGDCLVADLSRGDVEPIVTICRTTVTDLSARPRPALSRMGAPPSHEPAPLGRAAPALWALRGPAAGLCCYNAQLRSHPVEPAHASAPHQLTAARARASQTANEQTGGLVAAVLGMLGLEEKDVADGDTLESLGMDSMQVAEIRARLQRALGRPIPLEEVCAGACPRAPPAVPPVAAAPHGLSPERAQVFVVCLTVCSADSGGWFKWSLRSAEMHIDWRAVAGAPRIGLEHRPLSLCVTRAQVGALTVARMREVEAEAGLTPAPAADGAAGGGAEAEPAGADPEFAPAAQAPAAPEVQPRARDCV